MQIHRHRLLPSSPGTVRELVSLQFGPADAGPKAYIQASLHADEVPPMLVAQHLRLALTRLEAADALRGQVVLVPAANPIGLAQHPWRQAQGRFDLGSGENFNRHFTDLGEAAADRVRGRLTGYVESDVASVRAALREACAALPTGDELASLRRSLLGLAIDADLVLDLHCDHEAVMHLYTATPLWNEVEPLARLLGAEVALLATDSGDEPFDESCSMLWARLAGRLGAEGAHLPMACVAATVELRGEGDVDHRLAEQDTEALLRFLAVRGFIRGPREAERPAGRVEPRPLAGSLPVRAPHGGVLVFLAELGATLKAGQPLAELLDPLSGATTTLSSPTDGLLYARIRRRFVPAGATLAKVAGLAPVRSGRLMSA